jgi:hypothetical protein
LWVRKAHPYKSFFLNFCSHFFSSVMAFFASRTPNTVLHPGCKVRLHGLTSEAGLKVNGQEGECGEYFADVDRWAVTVADTKNRYKLANLEFVSASGGRAFQFVVVGPNNPQYTPEGAAEGPVPGVLRAKGKASEPAILAMLDPAAIDKQALTADLVKMGVPADSIPEMLKALMRE